MSRDVRYGENQRQIASNLTEKFVLNVHRFTDFHCPPVAPALSERILEAFRRSRRRITAPHLPFACERTLSRYAKCDGSPRRPPGHDSCDIPGRGPLAAVSAGALQAGLRIASNAARARNPDRVSPCLRACASTARRIRCGNVMLILAALSPSSLRSTSTIAQVQPR